jgi:hypothetical protein
LPRRTGHAHPKSVIFCVTFLVAANQEGCSACPKRPFPEPGELRQGDQGRTAGAQRRRGTPHKPRRWTSACRLLSQTWVTHAAAQSPSGFGGRGTVEFRAGDATELALPAASADLVFSNWLLMYLSDAEVAKLAADALSWARPRPPPPLGVPFEEPDGLFLFPRFDFSTDCHELAQVPQEPSPVWLHVFLAVPPVKRGGSARLAASPCLAPRGPGSPPTRCPGLRAPPLLRPVAAWSRARRCIARGSAGAEGRSASAPAAPGEGFSARGGCRWSRAAWSSSASPASGSRATSSAAPTPPTTGALAPARSHVLCPLRPASAALHSTRDALTVGGVVFGPSAH